MVVIFDCNIWITLIINGQLDFITDLTRNKNVVIGSFELRNEIVSVLYRPKLRKYISELDIPKALELYDFVVSNRKSGKIISITSDPKDDYLFSLSLKSKADYLVTGDKLILNVAKYKKTEIITLAKFKELFNL